MSAQPIASMTDAEREAHILDCGRLMLKAHREGDKALARHFLELQTEAIKARSPAQVERMEDCYFTAEGERARSAVRASLG